MKRNGSQGRRNREMIDTAIEISRGIEERNMPIDDRMETMKGKEIGSKL